MTPVGLEVYTPAPPTPERPAWVITLGDLWARIDGVCRPALVEDATGGGIEITTCERGLLTCGVSVAATELLTTSHAWCREDRDEVTKPWAGRTLLLTAADDEAATWRQVLQLSAVPVGFEVESQKCSGASLRALEKHNKKVERLAAQDKKKPELPDAADMLGQEEPPSSEPADPIPVWEGVQPVFGNRVCVHVDGFEVREGAVNDFTFDLEDVRVPNVPGEADCRQKCPRDQLSEFAEANASVRGKWFHPPGATSIALYPSWDACQASEVVEPSGVPADLCATLGAQLR